MTLKIASSNAFDQQDDKHEALQYNGQNLPEEYLKAKLSQTKDEA